MKTKSLVKLFPKDSHSEAARGLLLLYLDSLATMADDDIQKRLLKELIQKYVVLEKKVDSLLKNTLPETVSEEIKFAGGFRPRPYDCTVLFSDFVGFTRLAEKLSGKILIGLLDEIFTVFDDLTARFRGTKIKTIGDAYMSVFGAPGEYPGHAVMAVRAAVGMLRAVDAFNKEKGHNFQMRVGIHTGTVMAGVVGKERMQFDIFGDDVNVASRFESSSEGGQINVSEETFLRTRNFFEFKERGEISLKNKAGMKAYFVVGER